MYLLQHVLWYACSVAQSCLKLVGTSVDSSPALLCPWDLPGENTEVG